VPNERSLANTVSVTACGAEHPLQSWCHFGAPFVLSELEPDGSAKSCSMLVLHTGLCHDMFTAHHGPFFRPLFLSLLATKENEAGSSLVL